MGFFDKFKQLFARKEERRLSARDAMKRVQAALGESNYNAASIEAFRALEVMGEIHTEKPRTVSTTPREYAQILVQSGVPMEAMDPIIHNFELARYSPMEVTFDQYREAEVALKDLQVKFKSRSFDKVDKKKGRPSKRGKPAKKTRPRPKKRTTGGTTEEAAPRRRPRPKKSRKK
jgi:hypothetical protein